ncbi:MAG: DUF1800 domain-containing protein [Sphingorhabdus sp.]
MAVEAAIAMNRFGLGVMPGVEPPANPKNWLLDQFDRFTIRPDAIAALPARSELIVAIQELRMERRDRKAMPAAQTPEMLEEQRASYRKILRDQYAEAVETRLGLALTSRADFAERLMHFWANHFAVSTDMLIMMGLAGNFEFEAIRPNIFGSFTDLLKAATYHPAMLLYLDQAQSVGPNSKVAQRASARGNRDVGLNENLAREILELHTLGDRKSYTQADVTEFANAMTGLTIAGLGHGRMQPFAKTNIQPGDGIFVEALHEPGNRILAGKNYGQGGQAALTAILSDLATHPATARHIATKLARHFIADNPPPSLVAKLEANFNRTGGSLLALYRTLIEAPESWTAAQTKFKSPWEWTVSSLRALSIAALPGKAQAAVGLFNQMGQPVWQPGSPKGFGDVAADWAGPAGLMRRVETAGRFAKLAANRVDARHLAPDVLPGTLSSKTAEHIARAESPEQGLALLLVSPEFLRR